MTTATAPHTIDVRTLPDPQGCEDVLAQFDSLAPGESLIVLSAEAPRELLRRLQRDRKGLFEWCPLEAQPERCRIQVARRAAEADAVRGVNEALAWDHDRLDDLEVQAFESFARGEAARAREAWGDFAFGLKRHIAFEEEILFPAFEERVGFSPVAGPTAVMRMEHREIEDLVDRIGLALACDGDPLGLRAHLQRLLGQHNMKEEHVVYPGTDQHLAPEERDALIGRIQAF